MAAKTNLELDPFSQTMNRPGDKPGIVSPNTPVPEPPTPEQVFNQERDAAIQPRAPSAVPTTRQISQFNERKDRYTNSPAASLSDFNLSKFQLFTTAMVDSWRTSFGPSTVYGLYYDHLGKSGNLISKKDFDTFYSLGGQLEHKKDMTVEQADFAYRHKVQENTLGLRMQSGVQDFGSAFTTLAGGFFGGFGDPVTTGLTFVPVVGLEAWGARILRPTIRSVAQAGMGKQLVQTMYRGAVIGAGENLIFEPFIYNSQQKLQAEYSVQNSLMNVAGGGILGGFFGGLARGWSLRSAKARQAMIRATFIDAIRTSTSLRESMLQLDPRLAADKAMMVELETIEKAIDRIGEPISREAAARLFNRLQGMAIEKWEAGDGIIDVDAESPETSDPRTMIGSFLDIYERNKGRLEDLRARHAEATGNEKLALEPELERLEKTTRESAELYFDTYKRRMAYAEFDYWKRKIGRVQDANKVREAKANLARVARQIEIDRELHPVRPRDEKGRPLTAVDLDPEGWTAELSGKRPRMDTDYRDPIVKKKIKTEATRLLLQEALDTSWRARDAEGNLGKGVTESMARMADVMKALFRREVRFTDNPNLTGGGQARSDAPEFIFINTKKKDVVGLTRTIGHEFFHTIRFADPTTWRALVRVMLNADPKIFDKYYARTAQRESIPYKGKANWWADLSEGGRIEETFAEIMGDSFNEGSFWDALKKAIDDGALDKTTYQKIMGFVREMYLRIKSLLDQGRLPDLEVQELTTLASQLGTFLGERVGDLPDGGFSTQSVWTSRESVIKNGVKKQLLDDYEKLSPGLAERARQLEERVKEEMDNADLKALEDFAEIALINFWEAIYRNGDGNWEVNTTRPPINLEKLNIVHPLQYLAGIYRNQLQMKRESKGKGLGPNYEWNSKTGKWDDKPEARKIHWNEFPVLFIGLPENGGKPVNSKNYRQATHIVFYRHEGGYPDTHEMRGLETVARQQQEQDLLEQLKAPVSNTELEKQLPKHDLGWWLNADVGNQLEQSNKRIIKIRERAKELDTNLDEVSALDSRAQLDPDPKVNKEIRDLLEEYGTEQQKVSLLEYLGTGKKKGDRRQMIFEYYLKNLQQARDRLAMRAMENTQERYNPFTQFLDERHELRLAEKDAINKGRHLTGEALAKAEKSEVGKKLSPKRLAEIWGEFINERIKEGQFNADNIDIFGAQSTAYMLLNMLSKGADLEPNGTVRIDPRIMNEKLASPQTSMDDYLAIQSGVSRKFQYNDQIMGLLDRFQQANSEEIGRLISDSGTPGKSTPILDEAGNPVRTQPSEGAKSNLPELEQALEESYLLRKDWYAGDEYAAVMAVGQEQLDQAARIAESDQKNVNSEEGADPLDLVEDPTFRPRETEEYEDTLKSYEKAIPTMPKHVDDSYASAAKSMAERNKIRAQKLETHFTDLVTSTKKRLSQPGGMDAKLAELAKKRAEEKALAAGKPVGATAAPAKPVPPTQDMVNYGDVYARARNRRTVSNAVADLLFAQKEDGTPLIDLDAKSGAALLQFQKFVRMSRRLQIQESGVSVTAGEVGTFGFRENASEDVLGQRQMHSMWRRARALQAQKVAPADIVARLQKDAEIAEAVAIQRGIAQRQAENYWGNIAHKGYKYVMSAMDGQRRRGPKMSTGVETEVRINVARDVQPFLYALINNKVADQWMRGELVKDVMAHLEGIVSKNPVIVSLAESLRDTYKSIALRLNQGGAAISFLSDFSIRHVHNANLLRKAGPEEWLNDMLRWTDGAAILNDLGGVSEARMSAEGAIDFKSVTDLQGYLREVYTDIVTEHPREKLSSLTDEELANQGGNLSGRFDHHRKVKFKPGMYYEYLKKYGNPNPHHEVFQQLQSLSETATLLNTFGPNYMDTVAKIQKTLKEGGATNAQMFKSNITLQKLLGELDHPVETAFSEFGQTVRALANGAFLGMSAISSMVDVATSMSRMRYMGMSYGDIFKGYFGALSDSFRRAKNDEERAWFLGQSAGYAALTGSVSRRLTGELPGSNRARQINDWIFKWNGMNFWNTAVQESIVDVTTQHMARQAMLVRSGKAMDPQFAKAISRFGLTPAQFAILSKFSGKERFIVDNIPQDLEIGANRLRQFLNDTMNEAVLMPGVSDEAYLTLGMRAGTFEGEAIRTIMQYRTYPFALMRRTYRRLFDDIGEDAGNTWQTRFFNRSALDMYAFLGTSFMLGWFSLNLKEILKGREPLHFTDEDQYKFANVARIMKASGTLGLINDITAADTFDLLGPLGGQIQNAFDAEDFSEFAFEATEAIPGATLPGMIPMRRGILSVMLGQAGEQHVDAADRMLKVNFGQDKIVP